MDIALITGSSGLVGAAAARYFAANGFKVIGIDNNMREYFFGSEASTTWSGKQLEMELPDFSLFPIDIRDKDAVEKLFATYTSDIKIIIHAAAQPSHDWAAKEPLTDFTINANGTLVLLEMTRQYSPKAVFIFCSTNKVYGDRPNTLPLVEHEKRWEISPDHPYFERGVDETMSLDQCTHSLFGCSKVAADVLVQEYGRYFGLKTGIFRGGCLTGPGHSGAQLHGFLAYLLKCVMTGAPYTIFGYKGKQVRDNIHCSDLVDAFYHFFRDPRPGEVYNIGGSRHSNCSMLEAIELSEAIVGKKLNYSFNESNRTGDHIWWISDVSKFQAHYPHWRFQYSLRDLLIEIHQELKGRIEQSSPVQGSVA